MRDEVGDLADGQFGKRDNQKRKRKQVQFIRSQLLKFDKKTSLGGGVKQNRKQAEAELAAQEIDDNDDLIKCMSNMILKNNLPAKSPWTDPSSFMNNSSDMSTMILGGGSSHLMRSSKKEPKVGLRND